MSLNDWARTSVQYCIIFKFNIKVSRLIRQAERKHYEDLFIANKNNIKKSWEIIKHIINKTKSRSTIDTIVLDDELITNKKGIAKCFNNYFVDVGPAIARKWNTSSIDVMSYLGNYIKQTIFLKPVDEIELIDIINNLKECSPGWDSICSKIVKATAQYFIRPLLYIYNLSVLHGIFPDELKKANVLPFLNGDWWLVIVPW